MRTKPAHGTSLPQRVQGHSEQGAALEQAVGAVAAPDGYVPHVVFRFEHADYGLDVPHVRGKALGFLAVCEDAAAELGMKADQGGSKSALGDIDEWLRRKLRCVRLKHCKRAKPTVDFLVKCGVP